MGSRRTQLLFLLLILVVGGALALRATSNVELPFRPGSPSGPGRQPPPLWLKTTDTVRTLNIPLSPMREFDFKSKAEILALRRRLVLSQPQLVKPAYEPSQQVFGKITDGKPWWGLDGIYLNGPGKKSIAGPSEESRFLCNPFLLVGVLEPHAYLWRKRRPQQAFPPRPLSLTWKIGPRPVVKVRYEVGNYIKTLLRFRRSKRRITVLDFSAYNARDLGLNYLYLSPKYSRHIRMRRRPKTAVKIRHYIHSGGSCGYPGGCNNGSPYQAEMHFKLLNLPAKAMLSLWHDRPSKVTDPADLTYVIEFVNQPAPKKATH